MDNLVVFNYLSAPEIWPDKRLTTVHENLSPVMIYDQYSFGHNDCDLKS